MKKFTLTLIAALFVVGGAFSQSVVEKGRTLSDGTAVNLEAGVQNVKPLAKKSHRAARKGTYVAPFYTPAGGYTWTYNMLDGLGGNVNSSEASSVLISGYDPETNEVAISGMFTNTLYATINADGTFSIEPQVAGESSYGYYAIYPYDLVNGEWADAITGYIDQNKTLHFDENLELVRVLVSGDYAGYYLTPLWGEGSTISVDESINGLIEAVYYGDEEPTLFPATLSQTGNVVTIDKFLDYDQYGTTYPLDITLNADRTIEIPSQVVLDYRGMGVYFMMTYAADFEAGQYTDPTIIGKGNSGELQLGNFAVLYFDGDGNYRGAWDHIESAKIYFVDAAGQRYDYTQPSASLAPRFGFGGGEDGTTGIETAKVGQVVSESFVDMAGRKVTAATKGLVLKTVTYADGTKKTVKVINK